MRFACSPLGLRRAIHRLLTANSVTTHDDIATARYVHDFSQDLMVSDTLRYAHYEFSWNASMPNFGGNIPTPTTPLDDVLVGRDQPVAGHFVARAIGERSRLMHGEVPSGFSTLEFANVLFLFSQSQEAILAMLKRSSLRR